MQDRMRRTFFVEWSQAVALGRPGGARGKDDETTSVVRLTLTFPNYFPAT